uniref:Cyclin-dependent kinase 2 homolog n=1 Tax=Toxoplasma gondii COUG TaxID=1074873 RepID=A0A2G8YB56_TOXGO|nr:putative cell-cycle-associated protein kinase CDK [Toxoplasma gondii COUG]
MMDASASPDTPSTASSLLSSVLRRLLHPLFSSCAPNSPFSHQSPVPGPLDSHSSSSDALRPRSSSACIPDSGRQLASSLPSPSSSSAVSPATALPTSSLSVPFLTEERRRRILEELQRRCEQPPVLIVPASGSEEACGVRFLQPFFLAAKGEDSEETEGETSSSLSRRGIPPSVQILLSVFESQLREIQTTLAQRERTAEGKEAAHERGAGAEGVSVSAGPFSDSEEELLRDEASLLLLRRRCLQWVGLWRVATHAFSPSDRKRLRRFVDREKRKWEQTENTASHLSTSQDHVSAPSCPSSSPSSSSPSSSSSSSSAVCVRSKGEAERGDARGDSEWGGGAQSPEESNKKRERVSSESRGAGEENRKETRRSKKARTFYVMPMSDAGSYPSSSLTLNNFVKVQQVGQGAYGDVWLAEDVKNRRWVAMKKMKIMAPPPGALPANNPPHALAPRQEEHAKSRKVEREEKTREEKPTEKGGAAAVAAACQQMNNAGEEREGFPRTAIREICLLNELSKCKHTVELLAVVHSKPRLKDRHHRGAVWMVFEYLPFDLLGFLDAIRDSKEKREKYTRPQTWLSIGEIKGILLQLFTALHHCHRKNVVHRDLKSANLLMDTDGTVKLADFGLARKFTKFVTREPERVTRAMEAKGGEAIRVVLPCSVDEDADSAASRERSISSTQFADASSSSSLPGFLRGEALAASEKPALTNRVITLWYRPPELLLGSEAYDGSVDMWSAGCIMAELVCGMPLFAADKEAALLRQIVEKIGPPSESDLASLRALCPQHFRNLSGRGDGFARDPVFDGSGVDRSLEIQRLFKYRNQIGDEGWDLLRQLLAWNPATRITARAALQHRWFSTHPLPKRVEKRANLHAAHSYVSKHAQRRGGRDQRQMGGTSHARKGPGREGSADETRSERVSVGEVRLAAWARSVERKAARLEALRQLYSERQKQDESSRRSLPHSLPASTVSGVSTHERESSESILPSLSSSLVHPIPGRPSLSQVSGGGSQASFVSADLFPRKEREAFVQLPRESGSDLKDLPWQTADDRGEEREKGEVRREEEKHDSLPASLVSPPPVSTHFSPGSWNDHAEQTDGRSDRRHYGREDREGRRGREGAFDSLHATKEGVYGRCLREEEKRREQLRGSSGRRRSLDSEERESHPASRSGDKKRGRETERSNRGRREEGRRGESRPAFSPERPAFDESRRRGRERLSLHSAFASGGALKEDGRASLEASPVHASPGGSVSDMTNSSDEETKRRRGPDSARAGAESYQAIHGGEKSEGDSGKWRHARWPEWDKKAKIRDRAAERDYARCQGESVHAERHWAEEKSQSPSFSVSPDPPGSCGDYRRGEDAGVGDSRRMRKRASEETERCDAQSLSGKDGGKEKQGAVGREACEFGVEALSPVSLALFFPTHAEGCEDKKRSEKTGEAEANSSAVAKKQEERRRKAFDLFKRAAESKSGAASRGESTHAGSAEKEKLAKGRNHDDAGEVLGGSDDGRVRGEKRSSSLKGTREETRDARDRETEETPPGEEMESQVGYRHGRRRAGWRDAEELDRERMEERDVEEEKPFSCLLRDPCVEHRSPVNQEDPKRLSLPSVDSQLSSPDGGTPGVGRREEEARRHRGCDTVEEGERGMLGSNAYRRRDRSSGLYTRERDAESGERRRRRPHEASLSSRHERERKEEPLFLNRSSAHSSHSVSPFSPRHDDDIRGRDRKRRYPSLGAPCLSKEGRSLLFGVSLGSPVLGESRAMSSPSPVFSRSEPQSRLALQDEAERRRRGDRGETTSAVESRGNGKARTWYPGEKEPRGCERASDLCKSERASLGREDRAAHRPKDRRRDGEGQRRRHEEGGEGRESCDQFRERTSVRSTYNVDTHRRRGDDEKGRRKARDGKRRRVSDDKGGDSRPVSRRS